jgi:hypothetical protein
MAHEARTDWSMPLRSIWLLIVGCVNHTDLGLTIDGTPAAADDSSVP